MSIHEPLNSNHYFDESMFQMSIFQPLKPFFHQLVTENGGVGIYNKKVNSFRW